MIMSAPCLPTLVTIPAGVFNGVVIDSFRLGQTPVTNAEYGAHVDRFSDTPFVVLATSPDTQVTSLVARGRYPRDLLGAFAERLSKPCDTRVPLTFGALTLFQLRKDMSPEDFDRPNQPVVNVSWFHAFEYCVSNGFFLPSDDQWEYAARGPGGHKCVTRRGQLIREEAHDASDTTADVGSYPSNGFGLHDRNGNVWEWTAKNSSQKYPYGLHGGPWFDADPSFGRAACPSGNHFCPDNHRALGGFRVAAAPEDSK
jgi:formylglycine-generating enzyme required for sulfatase activity